MSEMENGARVTIREVYGLVERVEEKLSAELTVIAARMDQRFVEHNIIHEKHNKDHELDSQHRAQLWRWAVSTIAMTAAGLSGWAAFWWGHAPW